MSLQKILKIEVKEEDYSDQENREDEISFKKLNEVFFFFFNFSNLRKSGKTTNEKTKGKNFLFKRSSDACTFTNFSENQQKSYFK